MALLLYRTQYRCTFGFLHHLHRSNETWKLFISLHLRPLATVLASDSAIYIYLLIYLWSEVLWFIYLVHWTLACNKIMCVLLLLLLLLLLLTADIRDRLHWLPTHSRIDFKLGLLVYKCLHGIAPAYLMEMFVLKSTVPALSRFCSTARGDLLVPRTKTKTIRPRNFATSWARPREQTT